MADPQRKGQLCIPVTLIALDMVQFVPNGSICPQTVGGVSVSQKSDPINPYGALAVTSLSSNFGVRFW